MSGSRQLTVVALFVFFAITSGTQGAENRIVERSRPLKSTTGAVLRSMAIPGWGQFYNESYAKAAVFAIGQGTLIFSVRHEHFRMVNAKRDGNLPAEKFYRNSRNKLIWWLAGTVLLSMGDAYVDAQLFKLDVSPTLDGEEKIAGGVTATLRF